MKKFVRLRIPAPCPHSPGLRIHESIGCLTAPSVGGGHVSRVTWYTPVQGHGIQLTALQWNDE